MKSWNLDRFILSKFHWIFIQIKEKYYINFSTIIFQHISIFKNAWRNFWTCVPWNLWICTYKVSFWMIYQFWILTSLTIPLKYRTWEILQLLCSFLTSFPPTLRSSGNEARKCDETAKALVSRALVSSDILSKAVVLGSIPPWGEIILYYWMQKFHDRNFVNN